MEGFYFFVFKVILDELSGILDTAVFLYDREFRDKDDSLETLGKKKNRNSRSSKNSHESGDGQKPLQVSIFQSMVSDTYIFIIKQFIYKSHVFRTQILPQIRT